MRIFQKFVITDLPRILDGLEETMLQVGGALQSLGIRGVLQYRLHSVLAVLPARGPRESMQ